MIDCCKKPGRAPQFKSRVRMWATTLRVTPGQIRLQRMTRKWASCSPGGRLTFADDLLSESRDFQEYVIVHELLHLRGVRNHGKLFKALIRAHLGQSMTKDRLKRIETRLAGIRSRQRRSPGRHGARES